VTVIVSAYFSFFFALIFVFDSTQAQTNLVVEGIEQELHQVVTLLAIKSVGTLGVSLIKMNIHAPLSPIEEVLRWPSEILKTMCVVADRPVMFFLDLWTERCFVAVYHELVE